MTSEDEQGTCVLKKGDPLWEPFNQGWRRELVHRNEAGERRTRSDCYYFTPDGCKLRSLREIDDVLDEMDSPLSIRCFSMERRLLGAGASYEVERRAAQNSVAGGGTLRTQRSRRDHARRARDKALRRSSSQRPKRLPAAEPAPPAKPAAVTKTPRKTTTATAAAGRKRPAVPSMAAEAAAAVPPKRLITVVHPSQPKRPAAASPAAARPAAASPAAASPAAASPAAVTPSPRVVVVQARNGTLSRGSTVSGFGGGSQLLKCLTKGPSTPREPLPDAPKRKLKMMVKGTVPAAAAVCTAPDAAGGIGVGGVDMTAESAAAALRRLVTTRPWRLAVVDPAGQLELVDEPRRQHPWRRVYQSQLRRQADSGAPRNLHIGRVRQYAACSLFCSRTETVGRLPSLRCVGCCCLSHPACVGLATEIDRSVGDILCLDCFDRLKQRPGRRLTAQGTFRARERGAALPGRGRVSLDRTNHSESEVEEIVMVTADGDSDPDWSSSKKRSHGGGGSDRSGGKRDPLELLTSDEDDSSCVSIIDDDSDDNYDPFTSVWDEIKKIADSHSDDVQRLRAPPSLLRGAGPRTAASRRPPVLSSGPPALTAGPPSKAAGPPALAVGPPSLTRGPRPPPLRRAPAQPPDGAACTVLVNKATVTPRAATVRTEWALSPSVDGPVRPRRPSGQGGCKVRVTGPAAPTPSPAAGPVLPPTSMVLVVASSSASSTPQTPAVMIRHPTRPSWSPGTSRVITVKPRRSRGDGTDGAAAAGRQRSLDGDGSRQQESGSGDVTRPATGPAAPPASQPSQPSRPADPKVIKVSVRYKQESNGTVLVSRPAAAAAPVTSPAVAATNGLAGGWTVMVRGPAAGRDQSVASEPTPEVRRTPPGAPSKDAASDASPDTGGRRVTRARKRPPPKERGGAVPPAAKKRSWQTPGE